MAHPVPRAMQRLSSPVLGVVYAPASRDRSDHGHRRLPVPDQRVYRPRQHLVPLACHAATLNRRSVGGDPAQENVERHARHPRRRETNIFGSHPLRMPDFSPTRKSKVPRLTAACHIIGAPVPDATPARLPLNRTNPPAASGSNASLGATGASRWQNKGSSQRSWRRISASRLAGTDEERTLARLRALRGDLIDPAIAEHKGRVVKRTGDGTLVEFRSVVDAVRCAVEVQNAMVERNAGLPPERRIELRIGIHLGDVSRKATAISWAMASTSPPDSKASLSRARYAFPTTLTGRCGPGSISPSPISVITQAEEYRRTNGIYSLQVGNATQAQPQPAVRADQRARLELPDKPSIAVLPFSKMSGDS